MSIYIYIHIYIYIYIHTQREREREGTVVLGRPASARTPCTCADTAAYSFAACHATILVSPTQQVTSPSTKRMTGYKPIDQVLLWCKLLSWCTMRAEDAPDVRRHHSV